MSFKTATVLFVLLGASQPALAQAAKRATSQTQLRVNDLADRTTFENGIAALAVNAAFSPPATLSRKQYFSLLLLMSVPRNAIATHNQIQGAKQ